MMPRLSVTAIRVLILLRKILVIQIENGECYLGLLIVYEIGNSNIKKQIKINSVLTFSMPLYL